MLPKDSRHFYAQAVLTLLATLLCVFVIATPEKREDKAIAWSVVSALVAYWLPSPTQQ